jgi:uncharacterized protein (TIGR02444 family)
MDFPDHPFWDFSMAVHRQAGVHEACLALQTQYALDVNLLFFCCWAGVAGGAVLDAQQIRLAMNAVAGWQEEIVRPIWKARWRLKPFFNDFPREKTELLRQTLIEAELDAEHLEQLHLADRLAFAVTANLPDETKAARVVSNIFAYLDAVVETQPETVFDKAYITEPLTVLISACFPGRQDSQLKALIDAQWK